jgi:hypothetical protein
MDKTVYLGVRVPEGTQIGYCFFAVKGFPDAGQGIAADAKAAAYTG